MHFKDLAPKISVYSYEQVLSYKPAVLSALKVCLGKNPPLITMCSSGNFVAAATSALTFAPDVRRACRWHES